MQTGETPRLECRRVGETRVKFPVVSVSVGVSPVVAVNVRL